MFDFKARQKSVRELSDLPQDSTGGATFQALPSGGLRIYQFGFFSNSVTIPPQAIFGLKSFITEVYE